MNRWLPRCPRFRIMGPVFLVCLLSCSSAPAQEARLRGSLPMSGEVWVGQRVPLAVELLVPGYFSGVPNFDLPDPQGLLIVPPGGSPTISTEEVGGTSYTVQRHEFSVYTRTAGVQTIPPLTARLQYKRSPLDTEHHSAQLKTDALSFTAQWPPGAEKLGTVISTRGLRVVESWTPEPSKAKAGDAFTRTITLTAPDVPAMLFPAFSPAPIDGLGIYPKPPEVNDHTERGEMTGERRDSITYVCKRPGEYRIPSVRMSWWDLDGRALRTIELPARTLEVESNPSLAAGSTDAVDRSQWVLETKWLVVCALLVAAAACFLLGRRPLGRRLFSELRPVHLAPLNPLPQVEERSPMKAPGAWKHKCC